MNFSEWLLNELSKRNWSQSDLARNSGLTKQAIANYVGGRVPNRDALSDIAKALKIPMEVIYNAVNGKTSNTDEWVDEQSHKLSLLTPNKRSMAEKLLNALLEEDKPSVAAGRKARAKA